MQRKVVYWRRREERRNGGRKENGKGRVWYLSRNNSIGRNGGEIVMALIEKFELSCITLGERGTDCGGRRYASLQ